VPVAAAGLADVGAADADPAVTLRGGDQVDKKFAVGLLDEGALGEDAVRLGDLGGERVAHALQPPEVEHPGLPHGLDQVRHLHPPEPLRDQVPELPLEPPDLPPQLRARSQLGFQLPVLCHPLGYKGQTVDLSPVEQIRHRPDSKPPRGPRWQSITPPQQQSSAPRRRRPRRS
jgi:hypothetical protein